MVNKLEIHVVGLQRSGNHAIINWIMSQCPGLVVFLNNIALQGDPFLTAPQTEYKFTRKVNPLIAIKTQIAMHRRQKYIKTLFGNTASAWYKKMAVNCISSLNMMDKDCLIYSHEDFLLKDIFTQNFENSHDKVFGKSACQRNIIILRDPYNLFASRLKWLEKSRGDGCRIKLDIGQSREKIVNLWKEYAKEYLGYSNYINGSKIAINFNQWHTCLEYRKAIAQKLGLMFSDRGFEHVASHIGSSFDRFNFQGKASKMQILQRFKQYSGNKFYEDIFKDNELLDLSDKIFGKIR